MLFCSDLFMRLLPDGNRMVGNVSREKKGGGEKNPDYRVFRPTKRCSHEEKKGEIRPGTSVIQRMLGWRSVRKGKGKGKGRQAAARNLQVYSNFNRYR